MKKQFFQTIVLNLLKIWGCTWLGCLVIVIPIFIMRFNQVPQPVEFVFDGIIGVGGTMIFLFSFFIWEGRKPSCRDASPKTLIQMSIFPSLIWIVACCVFVGNTFIVMGAPTLLCTVILSTPVANFSIFTPLPVAVICGALYSLSIYLGYTYGKKHPKW